MGMSKSLDLRSSYYTSNLVFRIVEIDFRVRDCLVTVGPEVTLLYCHFRFKILGFHFDFGLDNHSTIISTFCQTSK